MVKYNGLTEGHQHQVDEYVANYNYEWYAVVYDDGNVVVMNKIGLSNILQCGGDPDDYDIIYIQQCGK
jgi:hypothetical protein